MAIGIVGSQDLWCMHLDSRLASDDVQPSQFTHKFSGLDWTRHTSHMM